MFSVAVLLLGLCPVVFTVAELTTAAVTHEWRASLNISATPFNIIYFHCIIVPLILF